MFMVEEHELLKLWGWDPIPAFVAKATIQSYIKPLTSLINSSFKNGIFSDELKITLRSY